MFRWANWGKKIQLWLSSQRDLDFVIEVAFTKGMRQHNLAHNRLANIFAQTQTIYTRVLHMCNSQTDSGLFNNISLNPFNKCVVSPKIPKDTLMMGVPSLLPIQRDIPHLKWFDWCLQCRKWAVQALLRINSENKSSPQSKCVCGEVSWKDAYEPCRCTLCTCILLQADTLKCACCCYVSLMCRTITGGSTLHLPLPSLHKPNKLSVQVKIPTSKTVRDSDPKVRNPVRFVKHTSSLCRQLFPESLFFGSSEKSSLQSSNMCSSDFIRVIIFLDFVHHRAEFLNDCVGSLPKLVEFWMLSFGDYWIVEKYWVSNFEVRW